MSDSNAASYDQVRDRLDEIVEAVSAPGISLDEALALYEEAVKLGLSACDLSEEGAEELLEQDAANLTTEQGEQANQADASDNQNSPVEGEAAAISVPAAFEAGLQRLDELARRGGGNV